MASELRVSRAKLRKYGKQLQAARKRRFALAEAGELDLARLTADEKRELFATVTEKKRQKALNDLFYFDKYVLGYRDMDDTPRRFMGRVRPGCHRELCDFVTARSKRTGHYYKRTLILEPRGVFKSSGVTIGYALWRALHHPNIRILLDSEEFGKSKAFSREIRDHVQHNEEFRRLFGALDSKRYKSQWTEAMWNVSTRTVYKKEPTFSCAGVDVTKVGMHYDLIICDDLVSDKNVTTREQIRKVIQHYKLLLSLLDPGGEMVVIGTRWDYGDLYGYLLGMDEERKERGRKPKWRKLIRPAYDEEGNLLFPTRLTESFLSAQKHDQGTFIFSAQYLNEPAGAEDAVFSRDQIEWFRELPQGVPMTYCITVDPSVGEKNDSDFTAILSVAIDPLNNWYVLEVDRGRWNTHEIVDMLVRVRRRMIQQYQCRPRVGMETVAFQKTLKFYADDLIRRRKLERFTIHEFRTDTQISKEKRIRGLQPHFQNGKVFFRGHEKQHTKGFEALCEEVEQFPRGKTRDCLDALAYLPQLLILPRVEEPDPKPPTLWERIVADRDRRGRFGRRTDVVGSRFRGSTQLYGP